MMKNIRFLNDDGSSENCGIFPHQRGVDLSIFRAPEQTTGVPVPPFSSKVNLGARMSLRIFGSSRVVSHHQFGMGITLGYDGNEWLYSRSLMVICLIYHHQLIYLEVCNWDSEWV